MYQMAKSLGLRATLRGELPAGTVAFVLAELFYKFHSFALETLAFLATWWVLSWLHRGLAALLQSRSAGRGDAAR